MTSDVQHLHVPAGHLYVLFGKPSIQSLCPSFNWFALLMLDCMSPLHACDINPLADTSFANIFSHSVDCLFILLIVSFALQKFLF